MGELKTKLTSESVERFLSQISDEILREDCFALAMLMTQFTKAEAKMWGTGIIGFGNRHYRYESGLEGDWFLVGFSPRKKSTIYLM